MLSDHSALMMREKIRSQLTFLVFRSLSHQFCKQTLYLHNVPEKKPIGTVLTLNNNNGRSGRLIFQHATNEFFLDNYFY